jgi:hypothetical protein
VLWVVIGYNLAFTRTTLDRQHYRFALEGFFLRRVARLVSHLAPTIPESFS